MTEDQFKEIGNQLRQPRGEAGVQTGIRMNEGNALINRFTFEALGPAPGELILEIGMGNGYFIRELLEMAPGLQYIGCDFSETMVEEATRLNRELVEGGRVEFFLSAADHLPVKDQSVDKIFTVNTLYFWPDVKTVLKEIDRVLKPGGKAVISIRPKWQMEQYPFTKFGFTMYERPDLERLLSENNFQVATVWEREEPLQEIAGQTYKVASLIVAAFKK
jgi:ubiquinone/menaquinone biosynthesis C-methylase UbiE